ncbi:S1/P1 nuclease [Novosphingobium rosa]|uniref:S1/P1 nuclease n=1 Tax=Novosphingobium rosa TaxID=76978 RepID=UPI00082F10A7|nr:S1/P1 nuclease [Novosphingobium rosa]
MISTTLRRKLAIAGAALAGMLAFTAQPALAWGELGHRTVGNIAYANVTPQVAAQIDVLLKQEAMLGTPECKVKTIGDAAVYPDCLNANRWRWAYTFPWHYQDIDIDKPFDVKEACSAGNCVTAQIERFRRILADRSLPPHQRLEALIFITHFVGDLHQPLHAAEHEHDAGGNGVTVTNVPAPSYIVNTVPPHLVDNSKKPANLHSVWDTVVVERAQKEGRLPAVRAYTAAERAKIATGEVADWAHESWDLAHDLVYPQAFGHVPAPGETTPKEVTLDDATLDKDATVASDRILQAGLRLARVLDQALTPAG